MRRIRAQAIEKTVATAHLWVLKPTPNLELSKWVNKEALASWQV